MHPPHPGKLRLPPFLSAKNNSSVALDLNKDASAAIFDSFRDKNLMHDQVRQINMFSLAFLQKESFQKKKHQLATWLIDGRLYTFTYKSILFHQI